MGNLGGSGSDNLSSRQSGIVNWCIIKMQINASKPLSALAASQARSISRRTDAAKNPALCRNLSGSTRRLWMLDDDKIMESRHFLLSIFFEARPGRGTLDGAQIESCEYSQ
jgi:hypothetical protein